MKYSQCITYLPVDNHPPRVVPQKEATQELAWEVLVG